MLIMTIQLQITWAFDREFDRDIVINKNQTLLVLSLTSETCVFSMETGTFVSSYAKS